MSVLIHAIDITATTAQTHKWSFLQQNFGKRSKLLLGSQSSILCASDIDGFDIKRSRSPVMRGNPSKYQPNTT